MDIPEWAVANPNDPDHSIDLLHGVVEPDDVAPDGSIYDLRAEYDEAQNNITVTPYDPNTVPF